MRTMTALAAGTALVSIAVAVPTSAAARPAYRAAAAALADPTSNRAPSQRFISACAGMSTSQADNAACDAAALADFAKARKAEGLPPPTLPSDFDTLSVPLQLMVITNIERMDRGLPPFPGLSGDLDGLSQVGADNDQPPAYPDPFPGTNGGRVVGAHGNSALLDDFYWMYDDGPGWTHRHAILRGYDSPLRTGAAVSSASGRTVMAEEFIGGDIDDPVDITPTWATIDANRTFGLPPTAPVLKVDTGRRGSLRIEAYGSGGAQALTATVSGAAWSLRATSCELTGTNVCPFVVDFHPASSGTWHGTLRVTGPSGTEAARLTGWQAPPRLSIAASAHTVTRGHRVRISGAITRYFAGTGIRGRRVTLQRRTSSGAPWRTLARQRSGSHGRVSFTLRPTRPASYRLASILASGRIEAKSRSLRIRVRS